MVIGDPAVVIGCLGLVLGGLGLGISFGNSISCLVWEVWGWFYVVQGGYRWSRSVSMWARFGGSSSSRVI